MKSETLRKIYSRHGLCNWSKAIDIIEGIDTLLQEASESQTKEFNDSFESIMKILKSRKVNHT